MGAADLIDLQSTSRWNHGTKYLMCVVDVFSKFALNNKDFIKTPQKGFSA